METVVDDNRRNILLVIQTQPMHPSSGDSFDGVMTSIFIAANMVYTNKKKTRLQNTNSYNLYES